MTLALEGAADWLREGGLLAYPTETVWGLGADSRSEASLDRLRRFKGRPDDAPVSILVTGAAALPALGIRLEGVGRRLAARFWPGPLTLVLRCEGRFARGVARADGAVGVRCSPHPAASALARRCEEAGVGPLTATSCNRSGAPAARTRAEAQGVCAGCAAVRWLAEGADAGGAQTGEAGAQRAAGERSPTGPGSTVVDVSGAEPRVLRWGALPHGVLAPLLEETARA